MAVFILYGPSGVGKTHVGDELSRQFDCPHFDADELLSITARKRLQSGKLLSPDMTDDYYAKVADTVLELSSIHPNIIVSQALIRQSSRQLIAQIVPDCHFIEIYSGEDLAMERVKQRNNWVNLELAQKVYAAYEPPTHNHLQIRNTRHTSSLKLAQSFIQLCKEIGCELPQRRSPQSVLCFFKQQAQHVAVTLRECFDSIEPSPGYRR